MEVSTPAFATFRRQPELMARRAPLPAVFVLEPSMRVAAELTASWCPAALVQTLHATSRVGVDAARLTLEHAIERSAARTVVLCAETTVRPDQAEDRERLLGACVALLDDPKLGPLLRDKGVAVEALWLDTSEGDVYRWDGAARRCVLVADSDLGRFFAEIRERAATAPSDRRAAT